MSRSTVQRTISIPVDLDALRRDHAARLPDLSTIATGALRAALEALGDVEVPPPPKPARTAKATAAAARRRGGRMGQ